MRPDSTDGRSECLLTAYDRRFSQAMAALPCRRPWVGEERDEIRNSLRKCLRIRDEWVPEIKVQCVKTSEKNDIEIRHFQTESWRNCRGAASIYQPRHAGPWPVVFLACGHAPGGRNAPAYRTAAERLASCGIAAVLSDNLGQGDRETMGHREVPRVFELGLSLQGMIVMESMAWLNWMQSQPQFDHARMAVAGNSGGGTLSMCLMALCNHQLAAASASGYPSSFEFIARKEKAHCHCNIIPDIVGELEMWQIFGSFAPKPLFLFQGKNDALFPLDVFHQMGARVCEAYMRSGATENLSVRILDGGHSWDSPRIDALVEFFCQCFGLPAHAPEAGAQLLPDDPRALVDWMADASSTESVAEMLAAPTNGELLPAKKIPIGPEESRSNKVLRADLERVIWQFETFLKKSKPSDAR